MSITEQIEEVKNEICNSFCKYPDTWDEETEGTELIDIATTWSNK